MQRHLSHFATLLAAILLPACQTGIDDETEPRGLVIEQADPDHVAALYESEQIELRLDARVVDGNVVSSITRLDGRPLTALALPASLDAIAGPQVVPPVLAAAESARAILEGDAEQLAIAYPAMLQALYASTADLGDAPIRQGVMHHISIIGAHQWRDVAPLTDEACSGGDGGEWHTPWMHLRVGEAAELGTFVERDGTSNVEICGWVSIACYLHDIACCDCGWGCGGGCTTGCGDGSCLGRCGGGCGSCDPW